MINEHGERNDTDMKNPMRRRIWREIKGETGKYVVIFIFMLAIIGVASGFFVADISLEDAYDNSFEKYNIEDGALRLPFMAVDGCGENAAVMLYDAIQKGGYISVEDIAATSGVNTSVIEKLKEKGVFEGLQDTAQMTFF